MTVVRKYPTVWADGVGWTTPENVCKVGEPDGTCASTNSIVVCDKRIYVSGFGFAIPAAAVLDHVGLGMHALLTRVNLAAQHLFWVVWNRLGWSDICEANRLASSLCAFCSDSGVDVDHTVLTVDDLNSENFVACIQAVSTYDNGSRWYATNDTVWIEVEYHLPPPPGGGLGDGAAALLSFLSAAMMSLKRRRRKRIAAVSLV